MLQRYVGFVNFDRQYIPKLAYNLIPLQLLLRKEVPFKLAQQQKDANFEINEYLLKASTSSLELPLPGKQLVTMCDASKHAAGYAP